MRPSRDYQEDAVLQEVEELLEQDRRDSFTSTTSTTAGGGGGHSRHSSRGHTPPLPPIRPTARTVLASHAALILTATLAARQLARLARLSSRSTVALPLAHFVALALAALVYGWLRPIRGHAHAAPSALELGKGSHLGVNAASSRRQAWAAGAVVAVCLNLRVWELRSGQPRLSEALEVRLVDFLFKRVCSLKLTSLASPTHRSLPFPRSSHSRHGLQAGCRPQACGTSHQRRRSRRRLPQRPSSSALPSLASLHTVVRSCSLSSAFRSRLLRW